MLTIRREQVRVFEETARHAFEEEMVRHLGGYAPKLCQVAGEANVRRAIREGILRARSYGLTNRGPVRLFLELTALYGRDFDTDPLLKSVSAALVSGLATDQSVLAQRLHERAATYLERVAGPGGLALIEALRRLADAEISEYLTPAGNHEEEALRALRVIHPERCKETDDLSLRRVVRAGIEQARRYPGAGVRGVALLIALPFALGHGYAHDPFYPWIAETLADTRIDTPVKRIERLEARARAYLAAAATYLEDRDDAEKES